VSLFLITFFLIYGGTHLYFFHKVKGSLCPGMISSLVLALFLLIMIISPILVRTLEKEGLETSARVTAYAGYLWMGFLFLFFSASIVFDIYNLIVQTAAYISSKDFSSLILSRRLLLALPIAYAVLTAVYGYFEALNIRPERLVVISPKIPKGAGRVTIVQVSDVHIGLIVRKERLERIIRVIRDASPDLIVSTGDLVDGQINRMTGLAEMLDELHPRFGKYAVIGNHEVYAGLGQALAFTEKAGFRVLRGEETVVGGVMNIVGVDDPAAEMTNLKYHVSEKEPLEGVDHDKFTLLLKHRPAVDKESLGLFDLQLSGHVHKGQIFPFNLFTCLFYPVKTGYSLFSQGSSLYVSRGTGTWGPPIRFMAPPEVTVIELSHSDR